jgi:hypothetical protein
MKPLAPYPFNTPGVYGLNKQAATTILGPEWATKATNLVIDDKGRLSTRQGYRRIASNVTTGDIETVHTGLNNAGTKTKYAADSDGKLYELVAGAWVDKTGAVTPASDGNWQFANFNGKVVAWHQDGRKVVQSAPGANFANITASSGTVPNGNAILAAFGRLWVIDNTTLYYSGLLNETDWATGGGNFNLKYGWPRGADTATGIAEFNGRLLAFGERSIVMYGSETGLTITDPSTDMVLIDTVDNIGCVNRDTIQVTGTDIVFLSHLGLQSFGRVIQERSAPVTDVIPQVRDYVAQQYASSTASKVTSAYASDYGFYVLCLAQTYIVVDTRVRLPDGSFRVTEWEQTATTAAVSDDLTGGLLMSHDDVLSRYQGVLDAVAYDGTGGTSVTGDWESGWQDWENIQPGSGAFDKFLKRVKMFIAGGASGTLQIKWYFNYSEAATTRNVTLAAAPDAAQYGIAQYAIDKYGTSLDITELSKPGAKGGRVLKIGAQITDSQTSFAINQITLYATRGKQAH